MEIHLTFIDLPELTLLVARAKSFPDGIAAVFENLERALPSLRGRKLYGVVYGGPAGVDYYAGVVPLDEEEGAGLGLAALTVPAGPYARASLFQWEERRDEIGPMVDAMIESVDADRFRPVLEFYRNSLELHLLVPVEA